MNLVGYQVTHKAFGEGVVTRWDSKYVTVRFANMEKTFVYPTAFNGFMTLTEEAAMEEIRADIAAAQAAKRRRTKAVRRSVRDKCAVVLSSLVARRQWSTAVDLEATKPQKICKRQGISPVSFFFFCTLQKIFYHICGEKSNKSARQNRGNVVH